MQQRSWTTIDKSNWGNGPWEDEPDKEQWADKATGLPCLLKRNHYGALCGYVGIAPAHPWYGKTHSELYEQEGFSGNVHGGLTYSDFCMEGDEGETICHVPDPGEPEPLWWLGFDCMHSMDFTPGNRDLHFGMGEQYRDIDYVKRECADLAQEIAGVG